VRIKHYNWFKNRWISDFNKRKEVRIKPT